jgi:5-methylcytosine-specific restriction protein A
VRGAARGGDRPGARVGGGGAFGARAAAEEQIAAKAPDYTPAELQVWGTALVEALDQDGEDSDDRPPGQVNELHLTRCAGGGGKLKGRFDDAAMFDRSPR